MLHIQEWRCVYRSRKWGMSVDPPCFLQACCPWELWCVQVSKALVMQSLAVFITQNNWLNLYPLILNLISGPITTPKADVGLKLPIFTSTLVSLVAVNSELTGRERNTTNETVQMLWNVYQKVNKDQTLYDITSVIDKFDFCWWFLLSSISAMILRVIVIAIFAYPQMISWILEILLFNQENKPVFHFLIKIIVC